VWAWVRACRSSNWTTRFRGGLVSDPQSDFAITLLDLATTNPADSKDPAADHAAVRIHLVPEPSTGVSLGLGVALMAAARRYS